VVNPGSATCHLNTLVLSGGTLSAAISNATYGNWNFDCGVSTPGNGSTSYILGGNAALSEAGGTVFNIGSGDTLDVTSVLAHTAVPDNGLIKSGNGRLVLSNVNTFTGGTTIDSGTLSVAADAALGSGTVTFGAPGLGTLEFNGSNALASAKAISLLANGTIAPDDRATATLSGSISGPGALIVNGSGTLVLSGTSTFSGGTVVSRGTLVLDDAAALGNGSSLTVGSASFFAPAVPSPGASAAPPSSPVPEPGTIVLLAAVGTYLLFHRTWY
jgi:autotransporter-associated beta strand protein